MLLNAVGDTTQDCVRLEPHIVPRKFQYLKTLPELEI